MFQLRHIGLTAHTRGWALIQGRNLRPVLKARQALPSMQTPNLGDTLHPTSLSLRRQASACAAAAATDMITHEALDVQRVSALSDNYVWLLTERSSGKIAVVDPSESKPVIAALQQRRLDYIFNTHHHYDHTGGNEELKAKYGCQVIGPKADEGRIPGIDIALDEGETFQFGDLSMHCYNTPGHTRGHVSFHIPQADALFPGDTLFVLGCGRLFEGDPATMWRSMSKFLDMPPQTRVFCAHEYTASNAKFAAHVDPDNPAMQQRKQEIDHMRSQGQATVPSLLADELRLNPFLRPGDAGIRKALGVPPDASDTDAFTAIRKAKDSF